MDPSREYPIVEDALVWAAMSLQQDLGDIGDLPHDLQNTTANIYYRYAYHIVMGLLTFQDGISDDLIENFQYIQTKTVNLGLAKNDVMCIKECISALRDIDKNSQPNTYKYAVQITLDNLKYNIPGWWKKTGIRRWMERMFIKPNEIPELIYEIKKRTK
jgi:hypothetical protein